MKKSVLLSMCLLFPPTCIHLGCSPESGGEEYDCSDPSRAEVIIDQHGVRHVYACSDEALFFASGYQMAVDRLYQAETLRRFALGRLSEILGEAGLLRDQQARTFNFKHWGRQDYLLMQELEPETAGLISAWVAGINRRVEEILTGAVPRPFGFGPEQLDFLPEYWAEEDPYIVLKGAGFANDKAVEHEVAISLFWMLFDVVKEIEILKPAHPVFAVPPEDRPATRSASRRRKPGRFPPRLDLTEAERLAVLEAAGRWLDSFPEGNGSNNWAIDGRFTENGRPLIAGDPHLGFDFFGTPYPLHMNSKAGGGSFNVAGFAYPGTPGVALGHNDKIMWTATTSTADVNDIWLFDRADDGVKVKIGDQELEPVQREEPIIVREPGGPAGQGQVISMQYEDLEGYGVIIPMEVMNIPISLNVLMNWTGFSARPVKWFMNLNRVSNLDEFEQAAEEMHEMNYNLLAANAKGIAYRVGVDVPRRHDVSGDRSPWKAMSAEDTPTLWTGDMLDPEHKPGSRAKQRGWIVTANNDPFGFSADGQIDNDPWYFGAYFFPGYRAKRLSNEVARLTARGEVTLEDMQSLQMDVNSQYADNLLPLLFAAHDKVANQDNLADFRDDPDLDRLVEVFRAWDRRMVRDSAGALAFQSFLHYVSQEALKDDLSIGYDMAADLWITYLFKVTDLALRGEFPKGDRILQQGRETILLTAASRTAEWLVDRFGGVEPAGYRYGDLKVTSFDHAYGYGIPLFVRPSDGGESTVAVSSNISFGEDAEHWASTWTVVERSLGTFAKDGTPQAYIQMPLGANADPQSQETLDALEGYIEGHYRRLLFKRTEIAESAREITALDTGGY